MLIIRFCSPNRRRRRSHYSHDGRPRDCALIPEAYRQAELALLAARFAFPDPHRPDVDRAIDLACRLLAGNRETPATVEVACLRYGTPLRDAEPVLRQMLGEHGVPVVEPEASDADRFRAALRAFGAGAIGLDEFSAIFYRMLLPWDEQAAVQRSLVLLLHELDHAVTAEDQREVVQRLRKTALRAGQPPSLSPTARDAVMPHRRPSPPMRSSGWKVRPHR